MSGAADQQGPEGMFGCVTERRGCDSGTTLMPSGYGVAKGAWESDSQSVRVLGEEEV
ncbi:Hypothetical protein DEACI_1879 [Acididesulfobacillus acetoxydans]|uniref:Uncharacterized protein n=1 Tax=Acididesulfobacillus acetoxydans TaxID=1561005 RepID=A0A8S0XBG9_9FIRM|nr:hypothetical protein [Acididesulfobacillus acetoxydans]CAA7601226.1 Hypothetical protein DEACI_1879 [Acididesulfobacillus acetoxydans]CEJ08495.1 Hypothetical protein DEACI_2972 [Acididesulfobacillus acetoxydans]